MVKIILLIWFVTSDGYFYQNQEIHDNFPDCMDRAAYLSNTYKNSTKVFNLMCKPETQFAKG